MFEISILSLWYWIIIIYYYYILNLKVGSFDHIYLNVNNWALQIPVYSWNVVVIIEGYWWKFVFTKISSRWWHTLFRKYFYFIEAFTGYNNWKFQFFMNFSQTLLCHSGQIEKNYRRNSIFWTSENSGWIYIQVRESLGIVICIFLKRFLHFLGKFFFNISVLIHQGNANQVYYTPNRSYSIPGNEIFHYNGWPGSNVRWTRTTLSSEIYSITSFNKLNLWDSIWNGVFSRQPDTGS